MKYFLIKSTQFIIVRADTDSQALSDYGCSLHSQHMSGNAMCYFQEPIEATDIWQARNILDEKLKMERR